MREQQRDRLGDHRACFGLPHDGVRHFFGTRHHTGTLVYETGVPAQTRDVSGQSWMLSVKQVHGTDALIVDRPLTGSDRFEGGWDALITDQPGVTVAVRTADACPVLVYDWRRKVQQQSMPDGGCAGWHRT